MLPIYVISYQFLGVKISLNGVYYTNNSIVINTDIGTGTAALFCMTTYRRCCNSRNPETQWYFPNGTQVPNNPALPYQRTRAPTGRVILNRNSESTTTGIFHCDIRGESGVTQSLYVGIYDSSSGECCTLSEWLVIGTEASSTPDKDSILQVFVVVMLNSISHVFNISD